MYGADMDNKADRRKAALRENLKRRKDQVRGQKVRREEPPETSVSEETSPDEGGRDGTKHDDAGSRN